MIDDANEQEKHETVSTPVELITACNGVAQENNEAAGGASDVERVVSQRQLEILRHAVGWPENYRNHFCTGEGSDDFEDCEALVAAGIMTRHKKGWVPDYIYTVGEQGMVLLANKI